VLTLNERVAALEARLASLEATQRDLLHELRNERHSLELRVEDLERFRAAHNALNHYRQEVVRLGLTRKQFWVGLVAVIVSAVAGSWGIIGTLLWFLGGR